MWVGSHRPMGGGLSLRWTSRPLAWASGWRSCMCGSLAWQALGEQACGVDIVQACGSSVGLWGGAWRAPPAVILVYCGMERPSMNWRLRVLMFQLSLVLYLSQVCLQPPSKVPGSWSSWDLWLCPSHHLGSLLVVDFWMCILSGSSQSPLPEGVSGLVRVWQLFECGYISGSQMIKAGNSLYL
jgi:hypothetical protein